MPEWLKNAVFYEIYPQSFYDTNNDGIGDINGIIEKLDYVKELGCSALWINPCFDSPFKDAGYDVRDYRKVAARYGTNQDLIRLFDNAHRKNIHVFLDLVPGHTSEEHEWFRLSKKQERNEYSDRYIWSDFCFTKTAEANYPYIGGEAERSATYLLNFFKCQPALNYGWGDRKESFQMRHDSEAAIATREAMKDVMRFWMDRGCDGFRVDMANSLVKNDDKDKSLTSLIWRNVREMFDKEYPDCALVSEWSNPEQSLKAGFHMDFLLNNLDNGYGTLVRDYQRHAGRNILSDPCFTGLAPSKDHPAYEDHSFFKKDAQGDILRFLNHYLQQYECTKKNGYISLITCNHDTVRPSFNLSDREIKLFYAFLFTMPGVPFLYYGDELGMRYQSLKTKEGGYFRTGSRTPMQWTTGRNLGFSLAGEKDLYLPTDPDGANYTVEAEENDPDSILNSVKSILKLRNEYTDLQSEPNLKILYAESGKLPFIYKRGSRILAVNPSSQSKSVNVAKDISDSQVLYSETRAPLWSLGEGNLNNGTLTIEGQSFAIF